MNNTFYLFTLINFLKYFNEEIQDRKPATLLSGIVVFQPVGYQIIAVIAILY